MRGTAVEHAQRGWSSAAIAETLERRQGYEHLHDLIEYAAKRLQPESLEDLTSNTFECIVDQPEAIAWLEKNRPDVVACAPRPIEDGHHCFAVAL
jgi:hypothetical protein